MTTVVLMCQYEAQSLTFLVSIEHIFLIVQKQIVKKKKDERVKGIFGANLECVPYLTVICCSLTVWTPALKNKNV